MLKEHLRPQFESQNDKMMNDRNMIRRNLQRPVSATPTRHLGVLPARPRRRRGVNRRAELKTNDIGELKNRVWFMQHRRVWFVQHRRVWFMHHRKVWFVQKNEHKGMQHWRLTIKHLSLPFPREGAIARETLQCETNKKTPPPAQCTKHRLQGLKHTRIHANYLFVYLSVNQSINRSINQINQSIYRSIDLSIYRSIDLSIYRSIHLSI